MKLYLVRHAEAVDRTPFLGEFGRYLTDDGRRQFRKTAAAVARLGLDPDCLVTSPLVRAVQTAELLAQAVGFGGLVIAADELAPGFDRRGLETVMQRYVPGKQLVCVGHEPDLGELAADLLGLSSPCPFKKGAVVCLRFDPLSGERATFRWMARGSSLVNDLGEWLQNRT
jgi:phosphohistidine phosphatase